jgi:inner membrane transporter RhtA
MSEARLHAVQYRSAAERVPPQAFFLVSALFHYLGPAFAVLLFSNVAPLGVAWLRIGSAAVIFAVWRQPWRLFARLNTHERYVVVGLGMTLAAMNACFYEAIARLPLVTVGAIEFVGPITLAAFGSRTPRNIAALVFAVAGVYLLTQVRLGGAAAGYVFAFANCALFIGYIILGHRISGGGGTMGGIDRLGAAMLIAMIAALPFGMRAAGVAFAHPLLLAAAVGVGVSSSVIPYICDQLAMARLSRATFSLMLSLLPATATVIGILVLRQYPTLAEISGIALVIVGVTLHRAAEK